MMHLMPKPPPPDRPSPLDALSILEFSVVTLILLLATWLGVTCCLTSEQDYRLRQTMSSYITVAKPADSTITP